MAQQLRAAATRRTILLAAAHVFDERGFDAATIKEIIDRAGCTKGALYFHFPSKEALADAVSGEQATWVEAYAHPGEDPLQHLIDGSYAFALGMLEDPMLRASIRLSVQTGGFRPETALGYQTWAEAVHSHLKAARALGQLLPTTSLLPVAECISACITGTQLFSEAVSDLNDLPRRLTLLWRVLLPSVVEPEHLSRLRVTPPRRPRAVRPGE